MAKDHVGCSGNLLPEAGKGVQDMTGLVNIN
jgi:hypothetical protein